MKKIKAVNDSNDGTDGYVILIIAREVFFSYLRVRLEFKLKSGL
jgi:hypothetical protein